MKRVQTARSLYPKRALGILGQSAVLSTVADPAICSAVACCAKAFLKLSSGIHTNSCSSWVLAPVLPDEASRDQRPANRPLAKPEVWELE